MHEVSLVLLKIKVRIKMRPLFHVQSMQTLMSPDISLGSIQERHLQLEASVSQRLKWGAGANPTLAAMLKHFEEMVAAKNSLIEVGF